MFAGLLAALVVLAATGTAGAAGGGSAQDGSGAIVAPKAGAKVAGGSVRLVVDAGPETSDLRAKLNGKAAGELFLANLKGHRRYLDASLADGLRRGKNTLTTWVDDGHGGYRRSQVHFTVTDPDPIASAGIDLHAAVGSKTELDGKLSRPASDHAPESVKWQAVSGPRHGDPVFTADHTLHPSFHADAIGTYEVEMTASGDGATTTDLATIYVVPPIPMIALETAVPADEKDPRPGIRVASNVLRAPYMRTATVSNYSGTVGGVDYKAVWQIVALQRSTTMLIWNRTYGVCSIPGKKGPYTCLLGKDGMPQEVQLAQELKDLGVGTLVVAASHPSGGPGNEWDAPDNNLYVTNNLGGIGFPGKDDKEVGEAVHDAKAGEMAGVGVPGLKPGEATISVGGSAGLNGYLTPDSSVPRHYSYVPPQRVAFDTRAGKECDAADCTVSQRIGGGGGTGGTEVKGTMASGKGGYLVSGFDRLSLAPLEHQVFVTATGQREDNGQGAGQVATEAMTNYIEGLRKHKAIVLVTSIHGPNQPKPILYSEGNGKGGADVAYAKLVDAIVSLGGTREDFVRAATEPNDDYALAGAAELEEGEAPSDASAGARLRGTFVPDQNSVYEARGVSEVAAPPDLLLNTVMQQPGTEAWPYEGDAEVSAAISAIGSETKLLGSRPRFAFWNNLKTKALADEARIEVEDVRAAEVPSVKARAFNKAKEELIRELKLVASVRSYMTLLAQPAGAGNEAWEKAATVSDELQDQINKLEKAATAQAEYFQIVENLLTIGSYLAGVGEFKTAAQFIQGVALAGQAAKTIYNIAYDGSSGKPSVKVKADQLAESLVEQGKENEAAFLRFGDQIVSDWSKLSLIGKYGGCNPEGSCGADGKYDDLGWSPDIATVARSATTRAFNREIYQRTVPLAFPIFDTGRIGLREKNAFGPRSFYCGAALVYYYPFERAPDLAHTINPTDLHPSNDETIWRVYLTVARDGTIYDWPPKAMLERMFNPIPTDTSDPNKGGLGMSPPEFMRQGEKIGKFTSGVGCYW